MRFFFKHDDLTDLFQTGYSSSFHPNVIKAFFRVMAIIAQAHDVRDIRELKGKRTEKLRGDRAEQYAIRLNDQFRLVFTIEKDREGNYLLIIEIVDYH